MIVYIKMSFSNLLVKYSVNSSLRNANAALLATRQGHTLRGKPPGVAKTLEQRLQAENPIDAELSERINIGFPKLRASRSQQMKERLAHLKSQHRNANLEKLARSNQLLIDVEQVEADSQKTTTPYDLKTIAEHFGVFEHLFGCAYFVPRVKLDIKYKLNESGVYSPVFNGNVIKPAEAAQAPEVNFDGLTDPITGEKSKVDNYWTLLATNPDGNLNDSNAECVHWFVANIPNGVVSKGDEIVSYLQPFPPKGIGYQRFVFVLYKQNAKIDFSDYKVTPSDNQNLEKRNFKTLDFYRKYQDDITPAGLAFFQTNWDKSLTNFYHNVLAIKEPIFEYDFPKPYLADQKQFPLKQPFNLYMDKHRDSKQVNKEYLVRKLKKTHPFEGPEQPLRYPNAHPIRGVPSWLKTEIKKERLGIGRINDY